LDVAKTVSTFSEWNMLNLRYGAEIKSAVTPDFPTDLFRLNFHGLYNRPLLARLYMTLPHINLVETNGIIYGDVSPNLREFPANCLAIDKDNGFDYYLFTSTSNIGYERYLNSVYRIDTAGNISVLDPQTLVATTTPPTWLQDCIQWLN
jgi:hypothetical protein